MSVIKGLYVCYIRLLYIINKASIKCLPAAKRLSWQDKDRLLVAGRACGR